RELPVVGLDRPGLPLPGPDGRVIYTKRGRFTDQGQPLDRADWGAAHLRLPSLEGNDFYLHLGGPQGPLRLHLAADGLPVADLDQVTLPKFARDTYPGWMADHQRLLLIPSAKLLIVVPHEDDRLELYRVDPWQLFANSKRHVLLFTTQPPREVVKGREFSY